MYMYSLLPFHAHLNCVLSYSYAQVLLSYDRFLKAGDLYPTYDPITSTAIFYEDTPKSTLKYDKSGKLQVGITSLTQCVLYYMNIVMSIVVMVILISIILHLYTPLPNTTGHLIL
jgi:hypothetical protein